VLPRGPVLSTCCHWWQTKSGGFLREGHPASCKWLQQVVNPTVKLLLTKYKDIFNEDVKPMEGPKMTIKLKDDARPKCILTAQPCPAHCSKELVRF
jgi:hypothetical protein